MKGTLLTPELLVQNIKPIIEACTLWQDKPLTAVVVANPTAGGFTQKKKSIQNECVLKNVAEKAVATVANGKKTEVKDIILYKTEYAGHATKIVEGLLKEAAESGKDYLIITAGGDGTHLEVQTALLKAAFADEAAKKIVNGKMTVLRLPFGTGNDGSDGRELAETLERLTKPAHFALQKAVKVWYEGEHPNGESKRKVDTYDSLDVLPPWYAFNIASIGIDAFITYMTNRTKGVMPGDFYQMWVDLACVFYGTKFPSKQMKITVYDKNGEQIDVVESAVEFCLLGVSGHRTYGSNHKILPTDETFCTVKKMGLVKKLLQKNTFSDGTHVGKPTTVLRTASKIRVDYNQDILVQMDGEVHLLQPAQYPLFMEHTEPVIRIIECNDAPYYKGADAI
jgi:diacylglycerol kinase family enzyme